MLQSNQIYLGDCLEKMQEIDDKSVDLILCDLPYGTTACKWDIIIPFEPLWAQYERIIKDKGAMVFTATQPFTTILIQSNIEMFRHNWIWDKVRGVGFQIAKYRPMMRTEDILVFSKKSPNYYPIMTLKDKIKKSKCYKQSESNPLKYNDGIERTYTHSYPTNIIQVSNASQKNKLHPTQKPVILMEYLIKTYSQENDLVLDNCFGSGSTLIAAKNLNRQFIGIEKEEKYFNIAKERLNLC
ncbi:MAG: site-specific DNA-methyltransferase [bacterium]|nr:site-specific DNA-methyltransferase [bacterium]